MGGPFLFCGKRKNPPGPRQRDELAPLHSITSSAPMLSDRGHSHRWGMPAVTLTLCALAVAGAFGMILELERGFGGLIHISPQPMLQAVKTLDAEATANGLTADIAPSAFGAPRGLQ